MSIPELSRLIRSNPGRGGASCNSISHFADLKFTPSGKVLFKNWHLPLNTAYKHGLGRTGTTFAPGGDLKVTRRCQDSTQREHLYGPVCSSENNELINIDSLLGWIHAQSPSRSIYYLKPSAIACPQRASGPIIEILLAVPFQGTLKNLLYLKRPSSHVCRHMYGVRDYVLRPIIMYGANVVTASGQIGGEIF